MAIDYELVCSIDLEVSFKIPTQIADFDKVASQGNHVKWAFA